MAVRHRYSLAFPRSRQNSSTTAYSAGSLAPVDRSDRVERAFELSVAALEPKSNALTLERLETIFCRAVNGAPEAHAQTIDFEHWLSVELRQIEDLARESIELLLGLRFIELGKIFGAPEIAHDFVLEAIAEQIERALDLADGGKAAI